MAEKRKRGQNFSADEKDKLIKLLVKHKDTILNKRTDGTTNQAKLDAWTSVTDEFNSSGFSYRTKESLIKLWEKLKSDAKIYGNAMKRCTSGTGGGPSTVKFDPILSQVCDILGRGCTGIDGVNDSDADDAVLKLNTEDEQLVVIELQEDIQSRQIAPLKSYSLSEFAPEENQEEAEEEEESTLEDWTISSKSSSTIERITRNKSNRSVKSLHKEKSTISTKSFPASLSKINMSKIMMSKTFNRTIQRSFSNKFMDRTSDSSSIISARTDDDIKVHAKSHAAHRRSLRLRSGRIYNPHFELLYCNEDESDMIKWESKYKKKTFEVSASDEYSKKAELLTKQICHDFYEWWIGVGSADYKSEVKCPEDLESLFQIWFDEHASRGLVLDPKIMPCVLKTIANYVGVPRAACPKALKRQIAWDIEKESSPAHTRAFNSSLPREAKHIPPQNRTAEIWHAVEVPQDLKSMTAIWGDISHLTSTKAFTKWLQLHPYLPMPPCLKDVGQPGEKKQLFVVPSDFVVREGSEDFSEHDLNIPVSQFSLEIKEVLSRLLHD